MGQKKSYPGGFRLTLATARRLAVQEFGTAKGLKPDDLTELEGYFKMEMRNLYISIRPDISMSGCIEVIVGMSTADHRCVGYFNRETLEPDFDVMEKCERKERQEALEQWVYGVGPESCHEVIDRIWNGERRSEVCQ